MILFCTPTIGIGGSLTEDCTPPSLLVGGSFVAIVNPRVKVGGAFIDKVAPNISIGGSLVDRIGVAVERGGSFLEQGALLVSIGGSVVLLVIPDAAVSAVFNSFAMNTKTAGMAEYDNFPFTSLFKVGTDCYGITSNGLFHHSGKRDDGSYIKAEMLTGISSFGIDQEKIVREAWPELRGNGEVELTIILNEQDEDDTISYTENCDNELKLKFQRMKLAIGVKGSHIQALFKNVDGSDFSLQSLHLLVQPTSRR